MANTRSTLNKANKWRQLNVANTHDNQGHILITSTLIVTAYFLLFRKTDEMPINCVGVITELRYYRMMFFFYFATYTHILKSVCTHASKIQLFVFWKRMDNICQSERSKISGDGTCFLIPLMYTVMNIVNGPFLDKMNFCLQVMVSSVFSGFHLSILMCCYIVEERLCRPGSISVVSLSQDRPDPYQNRRSIIRVLFSLCHFRSDS